MSDIVDNRFPEPGVDERFKTPGVDSRFPEPGVDTRFPEPGVDTRFTLNGQVPTPPTLSFLSSFDGENGATTAVDDSPYNHTMEFTGESAISTAQFKFGGASLRAPGSGGVIVPNHPAFLFGAGPFTLEFFVYHLTFPTNGAILAVKDTGTDEQSWGIVQRSASRAIRFQRKAEGGALVNALDVETSVVANTWYHYCVERDDSGNLRLYLDGGMIGKVTDTTSYADVVTNLSIGCQLLNGVRSSAMNGFIDELRISKEAKYATDGGFTVPTEAYPRG